MVFFCLLDNENLDLEGVEGVRKLKDNIFRQGFEITQAAPEHRGNYVCRLEGEGIKVTHKNDTLQPEDDPHVFTQYVRVKGMHCGYYFEYRMADESKCYVHFTLC